MKQVGVNNIVITPVMTDSKGEGEEDAESDKKQVGEAFSPGLTLKDVKAMKEIIPYIKNVSAFVSYKTSVIHSGKQSKAKIIGVNRSYFDLFNIELEKGTFFNGIQEMKGLPVCIIGQDIKKKMFKQSNPIGKYVKCGTVWLKIIGVLKNKSYSMQTMSDFNINNANQEIYAPINTILVRYKDRSAITKKDLKGNDMFFVRQGNSISFFEDGAGEVDGDIGRNQLNKIIVQVKESEQLKATSIMLGKMLLRRHNGKQDFQIVVPELLLKQEQRTKNIFNIVLGAIAGISLLVGGIGIMNIMLASVMERIKEIGVRLAIGARKKDVILQFLTEATIISVFGGMLGIILGVVLAKLITKVAGIYTIVAWDAVIVSFLVSAAVGIVFGWMPARKAASQNPVESLRYE